MLAPVLTQADYRSLALKSIRAPKIPIKPGQVHPPAEVALCIGLKRRIANIEHFRYHKLKANPHSYVFAPREK